MRNLSPKSNPVHPAAVVPITCIGRMYIVVSEEWKNHHPLADPEGILTW